MVNRRRLIFAGLAGTAATFVQPGALVSLLVPQKRMTLTLLSGKRTVTILKKPSSLISAAHAQRFDLRDYNYQLMASYQDWVSANKALAHWEQELRANELRDKWLHTGYAEQMRVVMAGYKNYDKIGKPRPWDSIQSVYGYALKNEQPTLFGLNARRDHVAIKRSVRGAVCVFDKIKEFYQDLDDEQVTVEQEATVGPQKSEKTVRIQVPNEQVPNEEVLLPGSGYRTTYGHLAVADQLVETDNGTIGHLAKFTMRDGKKAFEIV